MAEAGASDLDVAREAVKWIAATVGSLVCAFDGKNVVIAHFDPRVADTDARARHRESNARYMLRKRAAKAEAELAARPTIGLP